MSNLVRDNELRCLERMNAVVILMKTVFPADKEIMEMWYKTTKNVQEAIDLQTSSIIKLDKRKEL